ncbi:MAG: tetratricopeptide repeat protein [bacterium]|nr:tetratricopeptide repeat protein [bacterium]
MKKFPLITKVHVLLLGFTLIAFGCAYYNSLYNAKKNFEKGMKARQQPNATAASGRMEFEKVIDGCATLLEFYPKSKWVPDALLLMGKAYFETGQLSKAERKFKELLTNFPNHPLKGEATLELGRTYILLNRKDEGRALLSSLQNEGNSDLQITAGIVLAKTLIEDSLYTLALNRLEVLSKQATNKSKKLQIDLEKLFCYEQLKQTQEALELSNTILKDYPLHRAQEYDLRYKRANFCNELNQPELAIKDLKKLLKDSDFKTYRDKTKVIYGQSLINSGKIEEGLKVWEELLADEKNRSEETATAAYLRAMYFRQNQQNDTLIIRDLERVKRDRPGSVYSISADSLLRQIRTLSQITLNFEAIYQKLSSFQKLLKGDTVPDSLRRIYSRQKLVTEKKVVLSSSDNLLQIDSLDQKDSISIIYQGTQQDDQNLETTVDTSYVTTFLDTIKVLDAMNSIQKELVEVAAQLKDFYLTIKDTMKTIYYYDMILNLATGKKLNSFRYDYALFLQNIKKDHIADSLYYVIAQDTTDVQLSNHVRKQLKMELLSLPIDSIREDFLKAERYLFEQYDTLNALKFYNKVFQSDSGVYGKKAMYAIALLSENLISADSLKSLYNKSLQFHSNSVSRNYIQKRLSWLTQDQTKDTVATDTMDSNNKINDTTAFSQPDIKEMIPNEESKEEIEKSDLSPIDSTFLKPTVPTQIPYEE